MENFFQAAYELLREPFPQFLVFCLFICCIVLYITTRSPK